jgi:hypothetical protein
VYAPIFYPYFNKLAFSCTTPVQLELKSKLPHYRPERFMIGGGHLQ